MFGITTNKRLSDEYKTIPILWDTVMGELWSILFTNLHLDPHAVVVEIAPGLSTKIGLGLAQCHFLGALYVVEPIQKLLLETCASYRHILPEAKIYPINSRLKDCMNMLPQKSDFLVANHPLDDMILAYPFDHVPEEEESLFDWQLYDAEIVKQCVVKRWSRITSQPTSLERAKTDIALEWQNIIDSVRPKVSIISQYPSRTLKNNELQDLNEHASTLLHNLKRHLLRDRYLAHELKIQAILNQADNYNEVDIGTHILDSMNWLILAK